MTAALLLVVGASGAGKTTAVQALEARRLSGVRCYGFDSIGVPSAEVMEREWGGGERWQEAMTHRWLERLAQGSDDVAVLEGQMRPSFIQPHAIRLGLRNFRIVLLDCTPAARSIRLNGPRAQPELNNARMDAWAAYLRGQADALELPILDTSTRSVDEVADFLQQQLEDLRRE